jgi:hypothetical protein
VKLSQGSILAQVLAIIFVIIWGTVVELALAQEQADEVTQEDRAGLAQKKRTEGNRGRNPFFLPPGVYLLSKGGTTSSGKEGTTKPEGNPQDIDSLSVKAILISDHIRLAQIGRHIVTVGDRINDETVLKIKTDGVILGKGDTERTLFLRQSPVKLTVERNRQGESQ